MKFLCRPRLGQIDVIPVLVARHILPSHFLIILILQVIQFPVPLLDRFQPVAHLFRLVLIEAPPATACTAQEKATGRHVVQPPFHGLYIHIIHRNPAYTFFLQYLRLLSETRSSPINSVFSLSISGPLYSINITSSSCLAAAACVPSSPMP